MLHRISNAPNLFRNEEFEMVPPVVWGLLLMVNNPDSQDAGGMRITDGQQATDFLQTFNLVVPENVNMDAAVKWFNSAASAPGESGLRIQSVSRRVYQGIARAQSAALPPLTAHQSSKCQHIHTLRMPLARCRR